MKLLLPLLLAVCVSIAAAEPAPKVVRILNKKSGQNITIGSFEIEGGGVELLQQVRTGASNQSWILQAVAPRPGSIPGGQRVRLVNAEANGAIGVRFDARNQGAPAAIWTAPFGPQEIFRLIPAEGSWFFLENEASGKVLGVEGGSKHAGAKIVQWPRNASDDQRWMIIPVNQP